MRHWKAIVAVATLAVAGMAHSGLVHADGQNYGNMRNYRITITNATRGQVITPPVAIAHNGAYRLFDIGAPSSAELAALAENGVTEPLVTALNEDNNVYQVITGDLTPPGHKTTFDIVTTKPFPRLSVVGMLASTNDAFFAVSDIPLPRHGSRTFVAVAYDAGSEANSESCAYVPGPPCGSAGVHDPAEAEGFVHVHAGVHGIADLDKSELDWRNPVAIVRVTRIK